MKYFIIYLLFIIYYLFNISNGTLHISLLDTPLLSTKRPFYIIGHMVNSIDEINHYLNQGANAIEADIHFSPNGSAVSTFHGFPCDCFRHCNYQQDLIEYLIHMNKLTTPNSSIYNSKLALFYMDLKISQLTNESKANAGVDLANKLITYLFNGQDKTRIKVIISIAQFNDKIVLLNLIEEFNKRKMNHLIKSIGFDICLNDPMDCVKRMKLDNHLEHLNIWQGNGITNCLSPFFDISIVRQSVAQRNDPNSYVKKVYHWTVDFTEQIKIIMRHDVDGLITNYPDRVVSVIANNKKLTNRFRIADHNDNPFDKVLIGSEQADGQIIYEKSEDQFKESMFTFQQVSLMQVFINGLLDSINSLKSYFQYLLI